jgi:hypothetical protein
MIQWMSSRILVGEMADGADEDYGMKVGQSLLIFV